MTCGGEIHNAPETNRKLCTQLGLDYIGTAEIVMPENYIALFSTPNSAEEVNHILAAAVPALEQTAAAIESGGPGNGTETHGVWQIYDLYRQPDFLRHLRP